MTITLSPEQMRWVEAAVAAGQYASVEEAVRVAVDGLMVNSIDDLGWAKPYLDEARADIAAGRVVDGDEFLAWLEGRIKTLPAP